MTTATEVGYGEMRIAKVVGLATAEDEPSYYVVLEEVAGDRQLAFAIGQPEAFSLAARLGGIEWRRPMTGDSPEALRLRRALAAPLMTVGTVGMPGGDVGQRR